MAACHWAAEMFLLSPGFPGASWAVARLPHGHLRERVAQSHLAVGPSSRRIGSWQLCDTSRVLLMTSPIPVFLGDLRYDHAGVLAVEPR
jgi:hypothetical protein